MSLEQAITDHAAAIRELAAAIISTAGTQMRTSADAPAAAPKAETKTETKAPAAKPEKPKAEEKAKVEDDAKALDYDRDVAPALTAYMKENGRQAGVDLMAKFGAKKGAEIKPEDYAAVVEACTSVV